MLGGYAAMMITLLLIAAFAMIQRASMLCREVCDAVTTLREPADTLALRGRRDELAAIAERALLA